MDLMEPCRECQEVVDLVRQINKIFLHSDSMQLQAEWLGDQTDRRYNLAGGSLHVACGHCNSQRYRLSQEGEALKALILTPHREVAPY